MDTRVAGIVVGLLVAGLLALAPQSAAKTAPKKAHLAKAEKAKDTALSAAVKILAAMPEAERRAIQSDLAWVGDYLPVAAAGVPDERTIEAIKAFQKRNGGTETGQLNEQQRMLLAAAAKEPEQAVGWRLIDDPITGARLGLPGKLVPKAGASRSGSRWTSLQGQIQIETFRLREAALPALFHDETKTPPQREVGSSEIKPDSFLISGEQGLKKFLVRAEASGSEIRGVTILYDQATEGIMAPVAIAMVNSFRGFPDPNTGPPPGGRFNIEYGTAIVVDRSGDLIAPAPVVDECQTITVPGFGHAVRVADDKANDLALLRLYGARNLVPAALAGNGGTGDDLTLVGIADPRAEAGGLAATKAAAHLAAQSIDPVPKLGFAGAAAIDAQGRFAGMVDLKSAILADIGPATPQATLVPADVVRAFLKAQGINPAAGTSAIEQSVLRVICVRK
jgi:peptidoglycan hydrolase-like protein with peptidoglycan-binding domain